MSRTKQHELVRLILELRKHSISWSALTVGGVTIEGADMKAAENLPREVERPEAKRDIFTQYGRELLSDASTSDGLTSVVELDD